MKRLKIYNGNIITPHGIIPKGTLITEGNRIADIFPGDIQVDEADEIDARGNFVSPGFIDIHVHGGGGYDFMDGQEKAFLEIANTHTRYGTTSLMPTTLSSGRDELLTTLELYASADKKNTSGAQFVGMHIEGPYFAMNQRGAQDPRYIRDPDPEEYEFIISKTDVIKRWSAAPELKGALRFADYLKSKNILPALAHTDAIYEEVIKGYERGYTLATHLYSGMSGVTRRNAYRYAGVVESAFLIDGMDVEIIADGCHLPAPLLQLVLKIKGADRTALITDAMRGAGMPEGDSILGSKTNGLKVIIEDGVAKMPDRSSFAGSVATADRLVRNMITMAGATLEDAVKMMSATPARILNIHNKKGSLEKGKDADIIIFNENISISYTIVMGKVIHQNINQSANGKFTGVL